MRDFLSVFTGIRNSTKQHQLKMPSNIWIQILTNYSDLHWKHVHQHGHTCGVKRVPGGTVILLRQDHISQVADLMDWFVTWKETYWAHGDYNVRSMVRHEWVNVGGSAKSHAASNKVPNNFDHTSTADLWLAGWVLAQKLSTWRNNLVMNSELAQVAVAYLFHLNINFLKEVIIVLLQFKVIHLDYKVNIYENPNYTGDRTQSKGEVTLANSSWIPAFVLADYKQNITISPGCTVEKEKTKMKC